MTAPPITIATPFQLGTLCHAVFSPCRQWRYELWRRWGSDPYCMFIGLNPSTADEVNDDPTVRRCIRFARQWGYGALCMTNIFAWRATDPADMKAVPDPVGPGNDAALKRGAAGAGIVIAAWGNHGSHLGRDKEVLAMLSNLHCLKHTKTGAPGHPLYLRATTTPRPLRP
ncbi:MAG: DUF1643 domain-containing protein [Candidatus Omnitrophica bacterium]|nr:DUF1643 domain-containing protein [Candidatus Omnitrophota bacterium]